MTDSPHTNQLATTTTGDGEPTVVFTHGWADHRGAWTRTIDALGDTPRSVAWDLRAHGESEATPPGTYTRDHALGDLSRIVESVPTPCVLAGHSLGGYLSLAYTLLHPEHVAALVLVATGPGFRNPTSREGWNDYVDSAAAKMDLPEGSAEISKHTDSWVLDHLHEITVPAVVVVGERDTQFLASAAVFEKYLDVRANVTVPGAGHSVHRTHPESVAEPIRALLATVGS